MCTTFSERQSVSSSPAMDVRKYQGEKPHICRCDIPCDSKTTDSNIPVVEISVSLGEKLYICQI